MNLASAMKEAAEYGNWVYRDAPWSRLNAYERAIRLKYNKELAEMMDKYGPRYEAEFAKK